MCIRDSTGGVHSHADHWFGVLEMAKHMGAKDVYLHCITDGRDTDPHDGKHFLADLQAKLDELGIGKIASVSGRYYAKMCIRDRGNIVVLAFSLLFGKVFSKNGIPVTDVFGCSVKSVSKITRATLFHVCIAVCEFS